MIFCGGKTRWYQEARDQVVEAEDKEAPARAGVKTTPGGEGHGRRTGRSAPVVSVSARIAVTRPPMSAGYPVSNKSAPSAEPT
jgi:hypothetical protein